MNVSRDVFIYVLFTELLDSDVCSLPMPLAVSYLSSYYMVAHNSMTHVTLDQFDVSAHMVKVKCTVHVSWFVRSANL